MFKKNPNKDTFINASYKFLLEPHYIRIVGGVGGQKYSFAALSFTSKEELSLVSDI